MEWEWVFNVNYSINGNGNGLQKGNEGVDEKYLYLYTICIEETKKCQIKGYL